MVMHARVILGKVKLDKQDEAINFYQESVVPAAKEQKGFVSMNLLTDLDTNKFISITFWETEDDMISGYSSGYLQEQVGKGAVIFMSPQIEEPQKVSV